MKTKKKTVRAFFGPETRFELKPETVPVFRAVQENELERLKAKLLRERLDEVWDAQAISYLRRAANEAASLAWVTAYPLLVFPTLFEEKAEEAIMRAERQDQVRRVTRELLAV